jgi:hypothetical protein
MMVNILRNTEDFRFLGSTQPVDDRSRLGSSLGDLFCFRMKANCCSVNLDFLIGER